MPHHELSDTRPVKTDRRTAFILIATCSALNLFPGFAQTEFTYRAVIRDSITHAILSDVHICIDRDTVGIKNLSGGSFQLRVKEGSTVRFRKTGYRWLNLEIAKNSPAQIEMTPSVRSDLHDQVDEVEVNGKLLPEEEWDDLNPAYITQISVAVPEKKVKLIIRTR
jgi:hypothetical protein